MLHINILSYELDRHFVYTRYIWDKVQITHMSCTKCSFILCKYCVTNSTHFRLKKGHNNPIQNAGVKRIPDPNKKSYVATQVEINLIIISIE